MTISIIIPTLNEAENIGRLVRHLFDSADESVIEVIVCDGGSSDDTVRVAFEAGAKVTECPKKGRDAQMNIGARYAKGDILYFVHADCIPPPTFFRDIQKAIVEGSSLGRYRFRFDSRKWMLKFNSFFTRFDRIWCSGGDQTLFVKSAVFHELGGYVDDFLIMEEYDFVLRARCSNIYTIIPKEVVVSARKYDQNSWLRVQLANFRVMRMFRKGCSQEEMVGVYKKMLDYR